MWDHIMAKRKPKETLTDRGFKTGRFTLEEEEYVFAHCSTMNVDQIAKNLNRQEKAVRDFIRRHELVTPQNHRLRHKLYKKTYWKEVQAQLLEHEVEKFVITWIQLMEQFSEDFHYSEELQLKQFILCEILIDRAIRAQTAAIESTKKCEVAINKEREKEEPDPAAIANNVNAITQYNALAKQAFEERKELAKESGKLFEAIKGSRNQRITKIGDANKSFTAALEILEDPTTRELIGKDISLLHMAQKHATMKLYEYFKYADGRYDNPILNHETYTYLDEMGIEKEEENIDKEENIE